MFHRDGASRSPRSRATIAGVLALAVGSLGALTVPLTANAATDNTVSGTVVTSTGHIQSQSVFNPDLAVQLEQYDAQTDTWLSYFEGSDDLSANLNENHGDPDTSYSFTNVPDGEYRVDVQGESAYYDETDSDTFDIVDGSSFAVPQITVATQQTFTISGTVGTVDPGDPISTDVTAYVADGSNWDYFTSSHNDITGYDDDAIYADTYSLALRAGQSYRLQFTADGYTTQAYDGIDWAGDDGYASGSTLVSAASDDIDAVLDHAAGDPGPQYTSVQFTTAIPAGATYALQRLDGSAWTTVPGVDVDAQFGFANYQISDNATYRWVVSAPGYVTYVSPAFTRLSTDIGFGVALAAVPAPVVTAPSTPATITAALTFPTKPTPTIKGTAKVGKKLSAKVSKVKVAGTRTTYQWYSNGKKIKGATKSTFTIAKKYKGKKLTVKTTIKKAGYTSITKTSKAVKVK